jgi:hypothetical protein
VKEVPIVSNGAEIVTREVTATSLLHPQRLQTRILKPWLNGLLRLEAYNLISPTALPPPLFLPVEMHSVLVLRNFSPTKKLNVPHSNIFDH